VRGWKEELNNAGLLFIVERRGTDNYLQTGQRDTSLSLCQGTIDCSAPGNMYKPVEFQEAAMDKPLIL
jgi:hypothetical protein